MSEQLETQYRAMSYNDLANLRRQAVLTKEASAILDRVLKEKETDHFSGTILKKIQTAKESRNYSELSPEEIEYISKKIILTTESTPIDLRIATRLEIVSAECVYGMNIFSDIFLSIRDMVGGRSGAAQKILREARKTCLAELKREALIVGADAVVGVRLDYSEISGGGKSQMMMIVATGTAVKLQRPSI